MKNNLIQGIAIGNQVRFYLFDSTNLVIELQEINKLSVMATNIVGKSATITAMMAQMIKGEQKLSSTIDTNSSVGKIICTTRAPGKIKCSVTNPNLELKFSGNKLDLPEVIGTGRLSVVKDLGLKRPFVSEVELVAKDIVGDFTYYFANSEQIPTAISSGVHVDKSGKVMQAGGLMIQLLPGAEAKTIDYIEKIMLELNSLTKLLAEYSLQRIIEKLFGEDFQVLKEMTIKYECDCNYKRFENGLKMLSVDDLIELKQEQEIEVQCQFCLKKYQIKTSEL